MSLSPLSKIQLVQTQPELKKDIYKSTTIPYSFDIHQSFLLLTMKFLTFALLCLPLLAGAQRPSNTSICDFYSSTLLGSNAAKSQALLITLLVNTFVVGKYTTPNVGLPCTGFAAPAVFEGHDVALLPYFTGTYNSTNEGGESGVGGVLFLDDGCATPLQKNTSSNGDVGTR